MKIAAWLCLASILLPAQTVKKGSWNQVMTLAVDQKLEIYPFLGDRMRARFRSATQDSVSVRAGAGDFTFQRSEVRVLKLRKISGRFRNAGIGAAIGGGILFGVMFAALRGDISDGLAAAVLFGSTIFGAMIGFGIGLIPAAYTTAYEAARN